MRFRRFRRRRARATWDYCNAEQLEVNKNGQYSYSWLLPATRTNWLCDTDRVDHITYCGSHIWLDFWWRSNDTAGAAIPDITLFAIVTEQELGGEPADIGELSPWTPPTVPASVTTWTADPQYDGTDSYLWCHHIVGQSPPNSHVYAESGSITDFWNQTSFMGPGGTGSDNTSALVCRTFSVRAEWQPDVIIKSRRRLKKDEGVALIMQSDFPIGSSDNSHAFLNVRARTLVNKGR